MKRRLPWTTRLLVSGVVAALLFLWIPLGQLWEALRSVPLHLALAVLAVFLLGHAVSAFKWWGLLRHHDAVPLSHALRAHYVGLLARLCLPGAGGGDVVRAGWVMRHSQAKAEIGVACVADRLLDCLALLSLAALGVCWTASLTDVISRGLLVATVLAGLLVAGLGTAYLLLRRGSAGSLSARLAAAVQVVLERPAMLGCCFLLSLLVQGTFVVLNAALGSAAGVAVPLAAWFVAWPLAKLVASVPVSLGGLGVREGTLVLLLGPFGAPAALVTGAGLVWQAVAALGGLVGGAVSCLPIGSSSGSQKEPALP